MWRSKAIILSSLIALSGCGSKEPFLHTEIVTDTCIKPMMDYHYKTCNSIKFVVNDRKFEIPADFETDLASIPKVAWPIMAPAHSSLIRPAIIHDWFYRETCSFTRFQTDLIFYHMLRNDGVSSFKASIMYYAVRWFGWNYYNEDYCDSQFKEMSNASNDWQEQTLYKGIFRGGSYAGIETMDQRSRGVISQAI